ncbi:hypothetical protein NDU88_006615 [Pleurodeles waltl]|uniref:Uncharacterized protein n=1 Tax=Pleurodeles waltl TaxID=8319 RepID=A0AAV7QJ97_PLEWA|nr:hypothetical protein NDU88_006615 [Pleurodeles waltl]
MLHPPAKYPRHLRQREVSVPWRPSAPWVTEALRKEKALLERAWRSTYDKHSKAAYEQALAGFRKSAGCTLK